MTCHLCIHELHLMLKVFVVYKCMRDDSRLLFRSHSDALHVFVVSEKALKSSWCVPEDNKKVLN